MSKCELILQVLEDEQWHTSHDLYQRCGFMTLNSRVSELRSRGHLIEGRHVAGKSGTRGYEYRLSAGGACGSPPDGVDAPCAEPAPPAPSSPPAGQLILEVAA